MELLAYTLAFFGFFVLIKGIKPTMEWINNIIDKATFEDPHQYAVGVNFVLVNGIIVVENGNHNGNRPGRVLFGPGYRGN